MPNGKEADNKETITTRAESLCQQVESNAKKTRHKKACEQEGGVLLFSQSTELEFGDRAGVVA